MHSRFLDESKVSKPQSSHPEIQPLTEYSGVRFLGADDGVNDRLTESMIREAALGLCVWEVDAMSEVGAIEFEERNVGRLSRVGGGRRVRWSGEETERRW